MTQRSRYACPVKDITITVVPAVFAGAKRRNGGASCERKLKRASTTTYDFGLVRLVYEAE